MSLHISYYVGLSPAHDAPRDEYGEVDDEIYLSVEEDYLEWRGDGLSPGVYSFESSEVFHAGGAIGYGYWRDALADFAGYGLAKRIWDDPASYEGQPFVELIDFSDCEGIIGPHVSAKLAADFAAHRERADQHEDEGWKELYAQFQSAFEAASRNGCVLFH